MLFSSVRAGGGEHLAPRFDVHRRMSGLRENGALKRAADEYLAAVDYQLRAGRCRSSRRPTAIVFVSPPSMPILNLCSAGENSSHSFAFHAQANLHLETAERCPARRNRASPAPLHRPQSAIRPLARWAAYIPHNAAHTHRLRAERQDTPARRPATPGAVASSATRPTMPFPVALRVVRDAVRVFRRRLTTRELSTRMGQDGVCPAPPCRVRTGAAPRECRPCRSACRRSTPASPSAGAPAPTPRDVRSSLEVSPHRAGTRQRPA